MKLRTLTALSASLLLLLVSCSSDGESSQASGKKLATLKNSLSREVKDSRVVLEREKIEHALKNKTNFILTLNDSKDPIAYQLDDINQDGEWDELALVVDLPANSENSLLIDLSRESPKFVQRAHARLGYSQARTDTFVTVNEHTRPLDHVAQSKPFLYQFEGPGWENDKVGFRAYFDSRNGKDIFGKRTANMVIDSIGLPMNTPEGNYHKIKPWGMDVLKVGKSLGSGAITVLVGDSLHNISEETAHYKRLADGPVRAIVELTYKGWEINGTQYIVKEHITIWAGQYAYKNRLSISPASDDISFVTGLVNYKSIEKPLNWTKKGYSAIVSHDKQSENKDYMGLALLVTNDSFDSFLALDSLRTAVDHTSLVKLSSTPEYWFSACWELTDKKFKNKENFYAEVDKLGEEISSSVEVIY